MNAGMRAGVIGWPVAHSRSPLIHRHWLRQYGLAGSYDAIAVAPDAVEQFITDLPAAGFAGVNVTVPHKRVVHDILQRTGRLDESARQVAAVNLIVCTADGLEGRNTDGEGFLLGLRHQAPGWREEMAAVVMGAGGAAAAIVAALHRAGIGPIAIVNRTRARGEALAALVDPSEKSVRWRPALSLNKDVGLLVNATSLGMTGQPPLPVGPEELAGLGSGAVVAEIVYAPLCTPLLAAARARGLATADGLAMLMHQAVPAFAAWFGCRPDVTPALTELVRASLTRTPDDTGSGAESGATGGS